MYLTGIQEFSHSIISFSVLDKYEMFTPQASEQRTYPRDQDADRNIDYVMDNMRPLVVAKHVPADNTFDFRIVSREEIGIAEQYPVEENNIECLHSVEHDDEPDKELKESEAVPDPIPSA